MILLYLLIIPIFYIVVKFFLYFIVKKYGKFSYDGFSAAGFAYDSEKDIFYSTKNAWQKNFGYTHLYDVAAPLFRMIIDTEPIRFYYDNKNWLITFWKGQYGIVTGAEIGIYVTTQEKVNKKTIYLPVLDKEMLDMDLIFYKNGKMITRVHAKHWWLAVFKLGMFSNPKELTVDINITFPNRKMLEAFLDSFKKLRYKEKDYSVIDNTFCFNYIKPHTRKVWTRNIISDSITQHLNKKNVMRYNKYLDDFIDDNRIDDSKKINNKKYILVKDFIPEILKNRIDEEKSNTIIKKITDEHEDNIIFLHSDVYSNIRKDKL